MLLSVHVTSVLFLVWLNNFTLTSIGDTPSYSSCRSYVLLSTIRIDNLFFRKIASHCCNVTQWTGFKEELVHIGTWRAVWVPQQDGLGYTAFDPQLRKAYYFCHYTVCYTYVCACISTHMIYMESLRPFFVIWVCMIWITQAMPGPAGTYACTY